MKILSLLCLILVMVTIVAAFTMISVDPPAVDMAVHHARLSGDDDEREEEEGRLAREQTKRWFMIGGLFAASVLFAAGAYLTMRFGQQQ